MSKENFKISYDGPALASNEMDVKDLAPALLALGELFEEANRILNDEKVKTSVNIKATSPGSLNIDFSLVQDIITATKTLFNSNSVTAIVNAKELIGLLFLGCGGSGVGLFKFIAWLKKRKIKNITKLEDGKFKIEVEDGEIKYSNEKEIALFGSLSIRKKVEAIVRPLKSDGVEKIKIISASAQNTENEINKEQVEYFNAPEVEEEIIDEKEIEMSLQIVNISFQKDGKWRFSDGNATFFADILDPDFNNKVEQNEKVFAKDDLLKVRAIMIQSLSNGAIKTDYVIKKVLVHRSAAVQIKLPFSNKKE